MLVLAVDGMGTECGSGSDADYPVRHGSGKWCEPSTCTGCLILLYTLTESVQSVLAQQWSRFI